MNNDNKVETAIEGLNCWTSYATAYLWNDTLILSPEVRDFKFNLIYTGCLKKVPFKPVFH